MAFNTSVAGSIAHTGLTPLSHTAAVETWGTAAPSRSGRQSCIDWVTDEHCLIGHVVAPMRGDAATITCDLYRELLDFVAQSGFPHLLRVWHYLPGINDDSGDRELYRRFCVGRAQAFDERHCPPGHLPAGTAVGTGTGNDLLVYFIAAKQPGRQIENPRQVSAFDYPRRYSPRTPLFSRAVVWSDDRDAQLLVSGTASIVGHSSRHCNDAETQLAEVWRNLESLRKTAGATHPIALRIYVRNHADYPAIRNFLHKRLSPNVAALYLQADICRRELLLEIEGVYAMGGQTSRRIDV